MSEMATLLERLVAEITRLQKFPDAWRTLAGKEDLLRRGLRQGVETHSTAALAQVSRDQVIKTMYQTGLDMPSRYKETSQAGLAIHVVKC